MKLNVWASKAWFGLATLDQEWEFFDLSDLGPGCLMSDQVLEAKQKEDETILGLELATPEETLDAKKMSFILGLGLPTRTKKKKLNKKKHLVPFITREGK